MDWDRVIERNREALKRIAAALVAMSGLNTAIGSRQLEPELDPTSQGRAAPDLDCRLPIADCRFLPRRLHRAVLRLLRPAEAAARRLVVVAAREVVVELPNRRPRMPATASAFLRGRVGTGILMPRIALPGGTRPARRRILLPLLDPLPRPARRHPQSPGVPRITAPGVTPLHPVPPRRPPAPHDAIDATRLCLRLAALASALDDLPAHARRLARWRARRDPPPFYGGGGPPKAVEGASKRALRRLSPLRTGRPRALRRPNSRRPAHEVDEILADTHHFAFYALEPDTS